MQELFIILYKNRYTKLEIYTKKDKKVCISANTLVQMRVRIYIGLENVYESPKQYYMEELIF